MNKTESVDGSRACGCSTALRRQYVVRPRKTASVYFAMATVLSPPPIIWASGLMHWTSPGAWVAPALCGVFAVSASVIGVTYRFQAAKCDEILRR